MEKWDQVQVIKLIFHDCKIPNLIHGVIYTSIILHAMIRGMGGKNGKFN